MKFHPVVFTAILLFFPLVMLECSAPKQTHQQDVTAFVNPFSGTGDDGHVFPGASVPFGMVQLSPDQNKSGWGTVAGYNYQNDTISGFSHTHFNGTGIGDLLDISFMPVNRDVQPKPGHWHHYFREYYSRYSHDREEAEPGYYQVDLLSHDIRVKLTSTKRAGFHSYTFPESDSAAILIDLGFTRNWDKPVATGITIKNDSTLTGFRHSEGWAPDQKVFFAARLSKTPQQVQLLNDSGRWVKNTQQLKSKATKAIISYKTTKGEVVLAKVGLSSVSEEQALKNLDKEIPHWNFNSIRKQAHDTWEEQLGRIRIKSSDTSNLRKFYTAFYRTLLTPNTFSDTDGSYRDAQDSIRKARGYTEYATFSLWDTFRALHPWLTITRPDAVKDMVLSMADHADVYGSLPMWSFWKHENWCMSGYHSTPVIADAYQKGILDDVDMERIFKHMEATANGYYKPGAPKNPGLTKNIQNYNKYGYLPHDLHPDDKKGCNNENSSAAQTLEFAFDDWSIAQVAKGMDKEDAYAAFIERSQNFTHLLDTATGFIRPKYTDGTWKEDFDPDDAGGTAGFIEGSAWQFTWFVPHDIPALIDFMGGREAFCKKLDTFFTGDFKHSEEAYRGITGLIGKHAQGNEPTHHTPYLYAMAGQPQKTQKLARHIMDSLYHDNTKGIAGNEDCGQMSAWFTFSALGMYPVNPAAAEYITGTPLFEEVEWKLPNGNTFTIATENYKPGRWKVKTIRLNGEPMQGVAIKHAEIMKGGTLTFVMEENGS